MTLDDAIPSESGIYTLPRRYWAHFYCTAYDKKHGEAPPITALLCCGIGTRYARDIRNDLIRRGVIRPRTSCVRAWEEMRGEQ